MNEDAPEGLLGGFRRLFGEDPPEWVLVLAAVGALIVLAFVLHALTGIRGRGARRGRKRFRQFARANGLSGRESALLLSAAQAARLEEPAAIFFQRSAFEEVVRRLEASSERLGALRNKVYGP